MRFSPFSLLQLSNRAGARWRNLSGINPIKDVFKYQNGYYLRASVSGSAGSRFANFTWSTDGINWPTIAVSSPSAVGGTADIATDGTNIFTYHHIDLTTRQLRTYDASTFALIRSNDYSVGVGGALRIDTRADGKTFGVGPGELATFTTTDSITFTNLTLPRPTRAKHIGTTTLILNGENSPYLYADGSTNGTSLNLTEGVATFMPNTYSFYLDQAPNLATALAKCVILSRYSPEGEGAPIWKIYTADVKNTAGVLSITQVNVWDSAAYETQFVTPSLQGFAVHPISGDLFTVLYFDSISYLLRSMNNGASWQVMRQQSLNTLWHLTYSPAGLALINFSINRIEVSP
jgi:hypothetical protein